MDLCASTGVSGAHRGDRLTGCTSRRVPYLSLLHSDTCHGVLNMTEEDKGTLGCTHVPVDDGNEEGASGTREAGWPAASSSMGGAEEPVP